MQESTPKPRQCLRPALKQPHHKQHLVWFFYEWQVQVTEFVCVCVCVCVCVPPNTHTQAALSLEMLSARCWMLTFETEGHLLFAWSAVITSVRVALCQTDRGHTASPLPRVGAPFFFFFHFTYALFSHRSPSIQLLPYSGSDFSIECLIVEPHLVYVCISAPRLHCSLNTIIS